MKEKDKAEKYDKIKEGIKNGKASIRIENAEYLIISEELIRWMTEGTSPNMSPRSDCG
jgi:hypothetical protein